MQRRSLSVALAVTVAAALSSHVAADESSDPARIGTPRSAAVLPASAAYVAGEVLVRFKAGASEQVRARAHSALGARIERSYHAVPDLVLVKLPPDSSVDQAVKQYARDSSVLYAEPNYKVEADMIPNDPLFGQMWNLSNTGQDGGMPDADIDAPEAWDITTGSSAIVVAVIDTGIAYEHFDLAPNMFRNQADCNENGIDDDLDGYADDCYGIDTYNHDSDPADDSVHGSHVAGTIGANGNDSSAAPGVNWDVSLLACKFLDSNGSGTTAGAVECFDYVAMMHDRGVNIVATNNSWGGLGFSEALLDAIKAHQQRGILCIAAAGNRGVEVTQYPADYYVPNVIAVAATTRTDELATFSSRGKTTVHLGAPGQQILSVSSPGYLTLSGTSMAAPHVAGVAALLFARGHAWIAVKNRILSSGDPLTSLEDTTITGRRLNAYQALTCSNSVELARLRPIRAVGDGVLGFPLLLSALHVDCGLPNGDVDVTVSPTNETVRLYDDGIGVDQVAGDGIYSANWTPTANGTYSLTFSGGGGSVVVRVGSTALLNPEPQDGDRFGYSLSADDAGAVVGAPLDNYGGGDAGAAYLFDEDGTLLHVIHNPDPGVSDLFAYTVGQDADRVLVGALLDDTAGVDAGAAYLFDKNTGALLQTFVSPDPSPSQGFSWSLALLGDVAAVGAPRYLAHDDVGPAVVYLFSTATGALLDTLHDPGGADETGFGFALTTIRAELFVSALADHTVRVFNADPSSPTFGQLLRTIQEPAGQSAIASPGGFGWSLSASGERLLVGAPFSLVWSDPLTGGDRVSGAGAAFLYDAFSGELVHEFFGLLPYPSQYSGWSVALNGDSVVIGAPNDSQVTSAGGAAYRFDAGNGKLQQMLVGPELLPGDNVGFAVGLSGGFALASGDTDDSTGLDAGAVYRFAPPTAQDAHACYKTRAGRDFAKQEVSVDNLLGAATLSVASPAQYCTVTELDFEAVLDETAHLACHRAKAEDFVPKQLTLVSELGLERVEITRPTRLCVAATLNGSTAATGAGDYTCYRARRLPNTIALQPQYAHLADALGANSYIIGKLATVCLHSRVNGQLSGTFENHYSCHKLKNRTGFPRFTPTDIQTSDVFGAGRLRASNVSTICVVARRVDLPPIPGFAEEPGVP